MGLREVILSQRGDQIGTPVLLFGPESLDGGTAEGSSGAHPDAVTDAAAATGVDPDGLELFSAEAYLLQSSLGRARLVEAP